MFCFQRKLQENALPSLTERKKANCFSQTVQNCFGGREISESGILHSVDKEEPSFHTTEYLEDIQVELDMKENVSLTVCATFQKCGFCAGGHLVWSDINL